MCNYYIKTLGSDGNQLLGSDMTTIVRSCSYSGKKFNNAVKKHIEKINQLAETIKPSLKEGFTLEYEKF